MKVCSEDMIRELQSGDYIVCKGKRIIIGEILHQDFYKDNACYNNEDRSYIDIEFRDLSGAYHHWRSNLDGGGFGYAKKDDAITRFKELFLNGNKTVREVWEDLQTEGFSYQDRVVAMLKVLGDCVWED